MTTTAPTPSTSTYTSRPCLHGDFCWHECNSRNMSAAESFYSRLFGGTADACTGSPFPYTIVSVGGHATLGLMQMDEKFPADCPAHWLGYVAVDDIVATTANAKALGASVCVEPTDISIGRFSVITDPTGAVFSLFQANEGKTDGVNWSGPGCVGWNELMSTDPQKAADFYCKLLGWTATVGNDFGFPYWQFTAHGRPVGGLMAKCSEDKSPRSHWIQYVMTTNLNASIALVKTLGGTACCDSMEIPGIGRMAFFTDPNGAGFGMWEPAAPKKGGCSSGNCCCGN